jgi:hypothetical protein
METTPETEFASAEKIAPFSFLYDSYSHAGAVPSRVKNPKKMEKLARKSFEDERRLIRGKGEGKL